MAAPAIVAQSAHDERPMLGAEEGMQQTPDPSSQQQDAVESSTQDLSIPMSTAISPNDDPAVPSLLASIAALGDRYTTSHDNASRLELLAHGRSLVRALETPRETMIKHCWAQPSAFMCLTLGVDTALFHHLSRDPARPKTVAELAEATGVEAVLLARTMRHLASMGYISETAADEYLPTNFSLSLTIPIIGDGYPVTADCNVSLLRFPAYARKIGYREPNEAVGAYQYAMPTEESFFAYQASHPPLLQQFNRHMGGYRQGRPSWMDSGFFPVQDRLVKGAQTGKDDVLLVDVGGSLGHDIDEFARKYPDSPGRLVLEDLPAVVEQIKPGQIDARVEPVSCDFFAENPVKGARAYYMHSVLHDWPDAQSLAILSRIKEAMRPGYSKLLINENCIPDVGAHWESTALDMQMLSLVSARERTETQWRQLIEEKAGLSVVKVWSVGNGVESLIECELP
ncbi:uncharacterized protein LTR77_000159 [Saxophila tyrrhenica]|uniref:O-methyltransferase C-terminal domain-containing protein n=1 Tax=Saxophila tyrrhenica TaxID=1690608 RepID=A0AAV9PP02_9PEZI|nr:hypothetical protein LTR77_000159 [Saxophila tyrrhenica]